jgi:predicted PurR-regulated permease PerM
VAIGAQLGGIVGALLGIPFAGALKAVAAEVVAWRRGEDPALSRSESARPPMPPPVE